MNKLTKIISAWVGLPGAIFSLSVAAVILIATSCSTNKQDKTASGAAPTGTEKSGAQLWAENCQRCHITRSPSSYNDAQWEVGMMHMRVRVNLTPEEHKKILQFLKSGK